MVDGRDVGRGQAGRVARAGQRRRRIPDERERLLRSDPTNRDTDGNGFGDGFKDLMSEFGFDIRQPSRDTDRDGLEDDFERRIGTSPVNPDGWSDFDEVLNRFFGFDPLASTADSDFDGLFDDLEIRIGSSPANPDTNGDGINDFIAYSAGLNPAGPRIDGRFGELTGTTYSDAMRSALVAIRAGGSFPTRITGELPYAVATAPLVVSGRVRPSAALMQRSAYNPHNSPGIYKSYDDIVNDLFTIASQFNGTGGPDLVRLFVWSQPTVECCTAQGDREKPGRSIYAVKLSRNPGVNEKEPEMVLMGVHHARELITATFAVDLIGRLTKGYASGDPQIRRLVDNAEIWVLPVVNPNGYDRVVLAHTDWRKNTRKVVPNQVSIGVDLNRNYDFEHATRLTIAQRTALGTDAQAQNGMTPSGGFDVDDQTYGGPASFSEVETQAVRGLAHSQFAGENPHQVDGLVCSLSWHTYSGTVSHPMAHEPVVPPHTGLMPADRSALAALTSAVATAMSYNNIFDTFEKQRRTKGDPIDGYPTFGDSDDWLYKDGNTRSFLVEAYSAAEGSKDTYYPTTAAERDAVTAHNINGALAFIAACQP